jgi:hypothetical protein
LALRLDKGMAVWDRGTHWFGPAACIKAAAQNLRVTAHPAVGRMRGAARCR